MVIKAAARDLTPNETAAFMAYGNAVLAALEDKNMSAVRELASAGAGMLLRFNDFQKYHPNGDEPGHPSDG